ncbi:tigger transposable element-derived protein 1-like [Palaemon carinicauda]|uniref:tigger transposable element-derived protein 1-like n=1 Tax=Palaemon carinicauda TaxID=392227 RepID=UPI0035B61EC4
MIVNVPHASRGWFEKFRNRTGIHRVTRNGDAASSDQAAAEKYVGEFDRYIKEQNLIPQQVFNCDETRLFWKKMPSNNYITKDETKMPGHKPMKDRLTLLLCTNYSGGC